MKKLTIVLIMLLLLTGCRGEEFMTLRGRVIDDMTGEGLAGVRVEIGDIDLKTNTSGFFILEDIPVVEEVPLEDRFVKVGVSGYNTFVQELILEKGDKSLEIRLSPYSTKEESNDKVDEGNLKEQDLRGGIKLPEDINDGWSKDTNIVEERDEGLYDWERSIIQATGFGISPSFTKNKTQARIMAREAAITAAQRRLIELIDGVQIDSKQTVRNAQIESDIIERRISGLLKGARIVEEKELDEDSYMVVMEVHLYGKEGVIEAVLPILEGDGKSSRPIDNKEPNVKVNYTGVIINGTSDLKPALAPNIYSSRGELIYGMDTINVDGVVIDGLVSYSRSLADAKNNSRVGNNPLIIDTKGSRGDYNTDLIVSNNDAKVMKALEREGILSERRVIIVLN
ncbi:LPP20 family lipoprotein [Halonatronum saccharophilum]|uniref:LPP20 family lipoprotein n=1 Tax=Halonatronum saccharophilum TaxID=150060 RepID=UPI0004BB5EEC|nr:LPP20 family lipoprotein [Halonatronum saccharophilum]